MLATRSCHLNVLFWNLWLWCLIKWDKICFRCIIVNYVLCLDPAWPVTQLLGVILEMSSSIRFEQTVCCCSVFSKWEEFPIELLFLLFEFKNVWQRVWGVGSMNTRCESQRIWVQIPPNLWHSHARLQAPREGSSEVGTGQSQSGACWPPDLSESHPTYLCMFIIWLSLSL